MAHSIKIFLIAITFLLIVAIPPIFAEDGPQDNLILNSGDVIKCDKVWLSSKDSVRCKIGDTEWLFSTDEIDLEKTFGKSAAKTLKLERKDSRKHKEVYRPRVQETKFGSITLGVGKLSGYTKYQIGGTIDSPSGNAQVHFPISELDFPLDVSIVSAEISKESTEGWKFGLTLKKSLTSDAGTMKDSDWGVYYLEGYSWAEQNTLDVYSESDADLDAFIIDVDVQYRFYRKSVWSLSGGLGYMYQNFTYEISNLDQ